MQLRIKRTFFFEKENDGNRYVISIDAINFLKYYSPVFSFASGQSFTLPDVRLMTKEATAGNTVVVTSRRPLIENKTDKTVINVDASPASTGLMALEVLEKLPGGAARPLSGQLANR